MTTAPLPSMRALTVRQPFARRIVTGEKGIENRVWRIKYTGPLAIHSGVRADYGALDWEKGIVGVALMTGCHEASELCRARECSVIGGQEQGMQPEGKRLFHWELTEPIQFNVPVACAGKLGIWEVPDDAIPLVLEELRMINAAWPL